MPKIRAYDSDWEPIDLHCPGCGEKGTVWTSPTSDDYYLGEPRVCVGCGHSFYGGEGFGGFERQLADLRKALADSCASSVPG